MLAAGTIVITATQTATADFNPATGSRTLVVMASAPPTVTITASATGPVCPGTPVSFTAVPAGIVGQAHFQWQLNQVAVGIDQPTWTTVMLNDGDKVTCQISAASGNCSAPGVFSSNELIAHVRPAAQPEIRIAASLNPAGKGVKVTFTASVGDEGNTPVYRWYINGQSSGQNSMNFSSQNLSNGDVVTCILVSSLDCTVPVTSNTVTMIISTNTGRVLPSAFTPNGDGINDRWVVSGLEALPVFVQIFDSHGALFYQSKNYSNDFDGTINGKPLPFATYYYIIRQAGQPALSGALTIIR